MSEYKTPRNIVVDFDGTLCDFAYPDIGPIKKNAVATLKLFKSMGFNIIISSCRTCKYYPEIFAAKDGILGKYSKGHLAMVDWLEYNGVPYDEVDDGTKGKPMADYYIDDKGIRFEDNWREIGVNIHMRETGYTSSQMWLNFEEGVLNG